MIQFDEHICHMGGSTTNIPTFHLLLNFPASRLPCYDRNQPGSMGLPQGWCWGIPAGRTQGKWYEQMKMMTFEAVNLCLFFVFCWRIFPFKWTCFYCNDGWMFGCFCLDRFVCLQFIEIHDDHGTWFLFFCGSAGGNTLCSIVSQLGGRRLWMKHHKRKS